MATAILNVPDISCGHCEKAITNALRPLPGVERVMVEIPAKRVHVEYDERRMDVERMKQVLADADYPVASTE